MRLPITLLATALLFVTAGCSEDSISTSVDDASFAELTFDDAAAKRNGDGHEPRMHEYEVKIENLTSGQPLTPPTLTTHLRKVSLFTVGDPASEEIKEIAENGNLGPMIEALESNEGVREFVIASAGDPPPILPGASVTANIATYRGGAFLSFASMLVCTNDGFTGIDGLALPRRVGQTREVYTNAYDAGTEINTEDFADLVPPCQGLVGVSSDDEGTGVSNPELAENGVIRPHAGVAGGDDLQVDPHGWTDPVARVTITKVK